MAAARATLEDIRFQPQAKVAERWPSLLVIAGIYARDKYQCRYCGEKVILTPVMRLVARLFSDVFLDRSRLSGQWGP
ncbi:hypothetical protein EDD32_0425 [Georgenia muralis]|uniref:Transposase n=1 Tax=Georgenia muralis TaxID=154117 RepID=A0A3N4Z0B2_9MICO|nr:hypothetical protein EDD32_0425 [Georgenia muralis]